MASQHFSVKNGKIGRGQKHASYIAGQGRYAEKADVIFVADVNMPSWARDGADFFGVADRMERDNGRTYTEFEFAIPREIVDPIAYAKEFAVETLASNHPYRLAVHDKQASDGGRNVHAHLMFTERKLDGINRDADQFFRRANSKSPHKGGAAKDRKWHEKHMVENMRKTYSIFAKLHGVDLDLRSNLAKGLGEAEPKIGPVHGRTEKNSNRSNLVSKVENLRNNRMDDGGGDVLDNKLRHELEKHSKERRKQLWMTFHKQRSDNYLRLTEELKVSYSYQKQKIELIKSTYVKRRSDIKNNPGLKYVERRAAISIANMERITQELEVKAEFEAIRDVIKIEQKEHYFEKYRLFLEGYAKQGDEVAKAEVMRLVKNRPKLNLEQNSILTTGSINKLNPAAFNLKFEINRGGLVTYKIRGVDVIKDTGKQVDLLKTDALTVEAALKLAQAKFGNKLTLSGPREFQERAALVAAQKGLRVEFTDHSINQLMNKYKGELEMQRHLEMVEKHLLRAGKQLKTTDAIGQSTQVVIRQNVHLRNDQKYLLNNFEISFNDAKRVAESYGFEFIKPGNSSYSGTVIEITAHHAVQYLGRNRVVIHELAKINGDQSLIKGAKVEVSYVNQKPIIKIGQSHKPNTR
ncbi:MobA/MobL family protein [Methylophilus rhizosphaerae]|uniref:MobA/MobL family protein n=1 Tax=Methylophilus rhizosphaerae TaxID=492660 RepID=A0A1G9CND8_9PROT|nr:LPD7 domain-containing protein [Methylophilus rhizosphaerae]SDK52955.1 MobA/MobL family protein [Methylophilus rhizosphaerae]